MALILNEKKVRKGKALGLPYQGSKKKICKKVIELIKQNFDCDKPFYDIFGGGGAITAEAMINGFEVHYNDIEEMAGYMFYKVITSDRDYLKTLVISREEFFKIRDKETKTVDDNLKLIVNSFGNNRINYLYNESISDFKYKLAIKIIKNHDTFKNYRLTKTYLDCVGEVSDKNRLLQLERVQQLANLQQLERMQNMDISSLNITNYDYTYFSNLENTIIYLDPPYEGTHTKGYTVESFDSQKFYNWAYDMSKKNTVIVSSYEISDPRFKCIYEFKNARSTYAPNKKSGNQTEKLFMVID